jgi:hypothetical protein
VVQACEIAMIIVYNGNPAAIAVAAIMTSAVRRRGLEARRASRR